MLFVTEISTLMLLLVRWVKCLLGKMGNVCIGIEDAKRLILRIIMHVFGVKKDIINLILENVKEISVLNL